MDFKLSIINKRCLFCNPYCFQILSKSLIDETFFAFFSVADRSPASFVLPYLRKICCSGAIWWCTRTLTPSRVQYVTANLNVNTIVIHTSKGTVTIVQSIARIAINSLRIHVASKITLAFIPVSWHLSVGSVQKRSSFRPALRCTDALMWWTITICVSRAVFCRRALKCLRLIWEAVRQSCCTRKHKINTQHIFGFVCSRIAATLNYR